RPIVFGSRYGSSPRMWGTRCHLRVRKFARTVHPHACGEHSPRPTTSEPSRGSSPRMWGTRTLCVYILAKVRFIPTHVGNTITSVAGFHRIRRFIPTHVG